MYSIEVKKLPNLGSLICPDKVTTDQNQLKLTIINIEVRKFDVVWLHEKKVVQKSKKYDFQVDRKHGISKAVLVIDDLIVSDSGVYTAIVQDSTTGHKIEVKKGVSDIMEKF